MGGFCSGLAALQQAIEELDYNDQSAVRLMLSAFEELSKNSSGLKKTGARKILAVVYAIPSFLEELTSCFESRALDESHVAVTLWFLQEATVVVAHNRSDLLPRVRRLLDAIRKRATPYMRASIDSMNLLGSPGVGRQYSVEELRLMQPLHDNDFPDDFKKISVFPTLGELNAPLQAAPLIREWMGNPDAPVLKYLDRQFRFYRDDMILPLREELSETLSATSKTGKKKMRFTNPRIAEFSTDREFHVVVELQVPQELSKALKKCTTNKKAEAFFKNDGGERIFAFNSIVLFISNNRLVQLGVVVVPPVADVESKRDQPTISIGVRFQDSTLRSLIGQHTNFISDYAVQARTTVFSHEPVLHCLKGETVDAAIVVIC